MKATTILEATLKAVRATQADVVPPLTAAHEALSELNRFVQYPSLEIAEWDPARGIHQPLHTKRFPQKLLDALNGQVFLDDLCWPALHRDRRPKGWADTDAHINRADSALYQEFILPLGYREGVYLPLFHQERYVGMVTGNTDAPRPPGEAEMAALSAAAPALGEFLFRTRERRTRNEADGALLLDPGLNLTSFEPEHSHEVAELIRSVLLRTWPTRGQVSRFAIWPDESPAPVHVRVEGARRGAGGFYVSWREGPMPAGLSRRQAEVVTGIVEGCGNTEIGERLFTSPRTISKHVEHILVKLGVPNRSSVTRIAMVDGIYLLGHPAFSSLR
ncbi:helix-turn-helix transcriptional regulator [Dietzia sp. B44]|uniref:helix-turn-helix transcriptional regulator n=1 Tax=Dietzia sp. B44 TaxID=1630633 RepID=UPI0015FE109D|nr:helix-turn-helix transcriptional regulator [Dietzia sp. B44]MBB1053365.1 helix-turn-helix transcriptional regulator [Dietzia sp. B44]